MPASVTAIGHTIRTGFHMAVKGRTIGAAGGIGGALLLAFYLITGFEGRVDHVYPDPVTHGAPWTYCDGETTDKPDFSKKYAPAECDAITIARIKALDGLVMSCVGHTLPDNGSHPLPAKVRASFDSLAWNIGGHAFCISTLAKFAKAGDLLAACNQMSRWDKVAVGGEMRQIPGLTFRRGEEQKVCLEGARSQ